MWQAGPYLVSHQLNEQGEKWAVKISRSVLQRLPASKSVDPIPYDPSNDVKYSDEERTIRRQRDDMDVDYKCKKLKGKKSNIASDNSSEEKIRTKDWTFLFKVKRRQHLPLWESIKKILLFTYVIAAFYLYFLRTLKNLHPALWIEHIFHFCKYWKRQDKKKRKRKRNIHSPTLRYLGTWQINDRPRLRYNKQNWIACYQLS